MSNIKERIIKQCVICNSDFKVRPCYVNRLYTCSPVCRAKKRTLPRKSPGKFRKCASLVCIRCGSIFNRKNYKTSKYCSPKCQNDSHSERMYKGGGNQDENRKLRTSREYQEWRRGVFKRDNYSCVKCNKKGRIHAHHIIPFSKDKSKIYDLDNGMTLCLECHGKEHGLDFINKRYIKKCEDCKVKISHKAKRCCTCATKHQWKTNKSNIVKRIQIKKCIDCGKNIFYKSTRCYPCNSKHGHIIRKQNKLK